MPSGEIGPVRCENEEGKLAGMSHSSPTPDDPSGLEPSDIKNAIASDSITLRSGRPQDAVVVHGLIQPFVQASLLLDRSVSEIEQLTERSVVAEAAGAVIGFAAVEIYSRKLAEIQCLAVADPYQSRGVGKLMVAQCIKIAADANVLELMAISSSETFLKSCGFDYSLPGQKRALFVNP